MSNTQPSREDLFQNESNKFNSWLKTIGFGKEETPKVSSALSEQAKLTSSFLKGKEEDFKLRKAESEALERDTLSLEKSKLRLSQIKEEYVLLKEIDKENFAKAVKCHSEIQSLVEEFKNL